MTDERPNELPVAVVRGRDEQRRRISLIWAIPVITVLIAVWLAWDTLSKRGPEISIRFDAASSLQPKQSRIRYRDVDLGVVDKVQLTPDRRFVVVTASMTREAADLLTEKAQFWVVKPRFSAGAVSGLETLVSGSYIQLEPSGEGGTPARDFVGLEDPPVLHASVPGHSFRLKTARVGSLNAGSPVFFRDLAVGEVLGWDVGEMAKEVTIHVFVRAPYDKYVHNETVFWNASAVSVQLGSNGLKLELESLRALLLGGVAFDSPERAVDRPSSEEDHAFPLLADRQSADAAMFDRSLHFVSFFRDSVAGLDVGAPVVLHGIKIGSVTDVSLRYDATSEAVSARILYNMEPGRVADLDLPMGGDLDAKMRELVQRGLRIRLESANLLTGSKQLVMDIYPDAPAAALAKNGEDYVLPKLSGDQGDIGASVAALVARVQKIPFEDIGANLNKTLAGANGTINDPKLRAAIDSLGVTLNTARTLMESVNKSADPLLKTLPRVASDLQDAVKHADQLVASLDSPNGGGSQFGRDTSRLMLQLTDAARAIRILADLLARHPEAVVRGRAEQEVR